MKYLVTGSAGFIGFHTSLKLLQSGHEVIGVDSLNDYYDVRLKHMRSDVLRNHEKFEFIRLEVEDNDLQNVFENHDFDSIIHLAGRAGVRSSLKDPFVYVTSNTLGTLNVLELMRKYKVDKLVTASTSSVYSG